MGVFIPRTRNAFSGYNRFIRLRYVCRCGCLDGSTESDNKSYSGADNRVGNRGRDIVYMPDSRVRTEIHDRSDTQAYQESDTCIGHYDVLSD